jgi:hypothetical protein
MAVAVLPIPLLPGEAVLVVVQVAPVLDSEVK